MPTTPREVHFQASGRCIPINWRTNPHSYTRAGERDQVGHDPTRRVHRDIRRRAEPGAAAVPGGRVRRGSGWHQGARPHRANPRHFRAARENERRSSAGEIWYIYIYIRSIVTLFPKSTFFFFSTVCLICGTSSKHKKKSNFFIHSFVQVKSLSLFLVRTSVSQQQQQQQTKKVKTISAYFGRGKSSKCYGRSVASKIKQMFIAEGFLGKTAKQYGCRFAACKNRGFSTFFLWESKAAILWMPPEAGKSTRLFFKLLFGKAAACRHLLQHQTKVHVLGFKIFCLGEQQHLCLLQAASGKEITVFVGVFFWE